MNSPFVATAGDDDLLGELEGLVGPDEGGEDVGWNAADEQDYVDLVGEPSGRDIDQPAAEPEPPAEPPNYDDYFAKYDDATSRVNKLYDEMQARKAKEAEEAAKKAAEEKAQERIRALEKEVADKEAEKLALALGNSFPKFVSKVVQSFLR